MNCCFAERFSSGLDGWTQSIIDTLIIIGLDVVCDGRRAFINCTHDMLLQEFFLLLPAEKAVVEIQETVPVDEEVIAACQQLKLKGYRVALDNFVLGDGREQRVSHADYLKVDVRRVPRQDCPHS